MQKRELSFYSSCSESDLFHELSSKHGGLDENEAAMRLHRDGKNIIAEKKELNVFIDFVSHFGSPLVLILIVAAAVSFFLNEKIDAIIIGIMVLLSVILDFFLEHSAQKAAERLRQSVKTKAIALRSGQKKEVGTDELCVGDIILLAAGSMVPADARILESNDFFVNQSSLTGESYPAQKYPQTSKSQSLSEMHNIIFMGTNVISGTAKAIVVNIGKSTEYGKVAEHLTDPQVETEFDRGIAGFSSLIMKVTIFLVLFIFLVRSFIHHNYFESFMFAVAVAVGLTPELLPMVMSVTMGFGSNKMAKKGVIVKKLTSIPNFGSMDVLCTDKTGTLTEDKIKLVKYTNVKGTSSEQVLLYAYLNSNYQTGINNILDDAVLAYKKVDITGYTKIDEIPFDFVRKKMSVVVQKGKLRSIITKGAPEEIFKCSANYFSNGKKKKLDQKTIEVIKAKYSEFSSEGYRVLAIAIKEIETKGEYSKDDEKEMTLIGYVSFLDPAKSDVKEVLSDLSKAGIEVKVITGDNELVTKKICSEIGLTVKGVMLGSDLCSMTDDALKVKVEQTTIFARFSPDEKNRIILALKSNRHVVGYLGDGINDAPSLHTADIGISVNSAVDVTKESAAIILTRKSLAELRDGVMEGRKTFANTMKYIMMGLSSNFGNMFSVAIAVVFLPFLPMLPLQILLNNFIYDISQMTIPTDNVDPELISKPKKWDMKFLKKFMLVFGPVSSIYDILTFILLFFIFQVNTVQQAAIFQTAWFMESLATQTFIIFLIRTKKFPFIQSWPSIYLLISSLVCVGFGWILPYTKLGSFFGMVPIPWYIVVCLAGFIFMYFLTVQAAKILFFMKNDF
ncbi:MAG: magnesium-translocating P-type ATPase [archaeon]